MLKSKVLITLCVLVVLFGTVVILRSDQLISQDRQSKVESQARLTVSGIQQAINVELTRLKDIPFIHSDKLSKQAEVVAVFSAQVNSEKRIQFERSEVFRPPFKVEDLTNLIEKQIARKVQSSADIFISVLPRPATKQGTPAALPPAILFAWKEQQRISVVVMETRALQKMIEIFRTPGIQIVISNSISEVLAHSEEDYIGSNLQGGKFSEEALAPSPFGSGIYELSDQKKIFGLFEKLPQTELTILYSLPVSLIYSNREKVLLQFVLIILGALLVGGTLLHLVLRKHEDEDDRLKIQKAMLESEVAALKVKEKPKIVEVAAAAAGAKLPESESPDSAMKGVKKVVGALAHELNPALLQMLGRTNLIKEEKSPQKIRGYADELLVDIRKIKASLDKVFGWAGEKTENKSNSLITVPINQALIQMQALLQKNKIEVVQNFQTQSRLSLSPLKLQRAFEEILQNSADALERVESKKIEVNVKEEGQGILVEIRDNGEGIDSKYLEQIFDPFFTTRSHRKKQGLGLSAAIGILKEHGAVVAVESERGKFTSVQIRFPLEEKMKADSTRYVIEADQSGSDHDDNFGFEKILLKKTEPIKEDRAVEKRNQKVEVDLEKLLEVPESESPAPVSQQAIDGFNVDAPQFQFEPRPTLLDDHIAEVPQNLSERKDKKSKEI